MSIQTVGSIGDAVEEVLVAAGLTVFRNSGPANPEAAVPYCVVYTQPPLLDGPLGAPHDDAVTTVQVKSVGNGFGSAERTMDAARTAILTGITLPAGRAQSGPVEAVGGQPAIPDPDGTTKLWMGDELFRIPTTPA